MTQAELAASIGRFGQSAIANYETGIRHPNVTTLKAIRDVFLSKGIKCTLDDLADDMRAA